MIAFPTRLRDIARLLPICLLFAGSLPVQSVRAQDAVFDAISGHLFENVLYAQAELKINTPLLKLTDVAVGTGSKSFALLGSDGAYRLWNLQAGSQQAVIKTAKGTVFAPSANGMTFMVGGSDGSVKLIDPQSGKQFGSLPGQSAVTALATSQDDSPGSLPERRRATSLPGNLMAASRLGYCPARTSRFRSWLFRKTAGSLPLRPMADRSLSSTSQQGNRPP